MAEKKIVAYPTGICHLKYRNGTTDVVINNQVVTKGKAPIFVTFDKQMGISTGYSVEAVFAQIKRVDPNVKIEDVETWLLEKVKSGSLPVWTKEEYLRRTAGNRIADASKEIDDLKAENESLREKLEKLNKGK